MLEALVVGAGPAGSLAAWRLADAGARVLIVDREAFPRDKLCGDTLNPGAVAFLAALPFSRNPLAFALPLQGLVVTGPRTRIEARYGNGVCGRSILRRDFDDWLLSEAIAAGARFESGLKARGAIVNSTGSTPVVRGAVLARSGASDLRVPATMTIAADGRASAMARSVSIARHPKRPRRWAFGTYMSDVRGVGDLGEMHVRGQKYVGISPVPSGLSNVCVVTGPKPRGRTPREVILQVINEDRLLRDRFATADFASPVKVLGPLAFEVDRAGVEGLLLAGDAAGFVDPMTGDGLHLALKGAWLAAGETLTALETGKLSAAVSSLQAARKEELGAKLRFNRWLRRLVEAPLAVELAGLGACVAPGMVRWAVRYAGDAA